MYQRSRMLDEFEYAEFFSDLKKSLWKIVRNLRAYVLSSANKAWNRANPLAQTI